MNKKSLAWLSIAAAVFTQPVFAHNIWLEKTDTGYEINNGYAPDTKDPLPFERISWVKGFTENNYMVKQHPITEPYGKSPDAGRVSIKPFMDYPLVTAKITNGYYVAVEDATAERGYTYLKGKNFSDIDPMGQNIVKTFYSVKFAKYISDWNLNHYWPIGQRLEIVPLTNVTKLKEGDTLKYIIYYEGKAVNGENTYVYPSSGIGLSKETNPKTALDGTYFVQSVTVGAPGLQTVVVKHKDMLNEEGTKYVSATSVLSFNTE